MILSEKIKGKVIIPNKERSFVYYVDIQPNLFNFLLLYKLKRTILYLIIGVVKWNVQFLNLLFDKEHLVNFLGNFTKFPESSEELDIYNKSYFIQYYFVIACLPIKISGKVFKVVIVFHILFEFLTSCKWNTVRCAQKTIIKPGGDII